MSNRWGAFEQQGGRYLVRIILFTNRILQNNAHKYCTFLMLGGSYTGYVKYKSFLNMLSIDACKIL